MVTFPGARPLRLFSASKFPFNVDRDRNSPTSASVLSVVSLLFKRVLEYWVANAYSCPVSYLLDLVVGLREARANYST
jgi:hypothetical protein